MRINFSPEVLTYKKLITEAETTIGYSMNGSKKRKLQFTTPSHSTTSVAYTTTRGMSKKYSRNGSSYTGGSSLSLGGTTGVTGASILSSRLTDSSLGFGGTSTFGGGRGDSKDVDLDMSLSGSSSSGGVTKSSFMDLTTNTTKTSTTKTSSLTSSITKRSTNMEEDTVLMSNTARNATIGTNTTPVFAIDGFENSQYGGPWITIKNCSKATESLIGWSLEVQNTTGTVHAFKFPNKRVKSGDEIRIVTPKTTDRKKEI
eukprot:UN31196